MADQRPFAGISQEDTQEALLIVLRALLAAIPRTDANKRLIVNGSEIANASAPVTLASLPTLVDLNRINAMGTTAATSRPADAIPLHISNVGAQHIYNMITVT